MQAIEVLSDFAETTSALVTVNLPVQSASPSELPCRFIQLRCRNEAQTSASPPHAVVVDAATDSVLLALDPESAMEESAQRDAQQADAAPEEAAEAEQDPRSLQGAVEALAKFTSETVVGESSMRHR